MMDSLVSDSILTPDQRALLVAAMNQIIPATDALPGAGEFCAATVEGLFASRPGLRRNFFDGLDQIELTAGRTAGRSFVDLEPESQDAVLRVVEVSRPDFFALLVGHTYRAYYVDPRVVTRLGLEARPPQPLGHSLPAFDPALLNQVRERGPIWRMTANE
jgi:hypothetical protein